MIFIILSNLLLIFIGAITFFYIYAKYKQTYWAKLGIYSPPCHWFFGHFTDAFFMRKSFPQAFADLHNSIDIDEPVVGVYVLQKPFLLLRDPEVIKRVLIKDFHVFSNRYFAAKRQTDVIGCKNLFSIGNPQWKYIRSKLSPAFTTGKVKKYFPFVLASAENMKKYLEFQVTDDAEKVAIECRQLCDKYTTDFIINFAFGIQTNSFTTVESQIYLRTRKLFQLDLVRAIQIFATFFYPTMSDYLGGSMLDKSTDYFRQIFWKSVNERERSGIKIGDIIDLLIDLKNEKQSSKFAFEGDYLVAQSAVLLLAGIETSALTISFTLLELAKNPEIQEKVRREIREKLSNELTYEKVSEMTYLNQVVSETLRLYPPVPLIDRVSIQDYKIPGTEITIEKGTAVYAALMGLHQDPRYYSNPWEYNPDRFSEQQKNNIRPCTYMPFGEGPRICIGMRIGQIQTLTGLVTILNEYEVTLNPKYKNKLSMRSMLLAPADGIRLYFTKL